MFLFYIKKFIKGIHESEHSPLTDFKLCYESFMKAEDDASFVEESSCIH